MSDEGRSVELPEFETSDSARTSLSMTVPFVSSPMNIHRPLRPATGWLRLSDRGRDACGSSADHSAGIADGGQVARLVAAPDLEDEPCTVCHHLLVLDSAMHGERVTW